MHKDSHGIKKSRAKKKRWKEGMMIGRSRKGICMQHGITLLFKRRRPLYFISLLFTHFITQTQTHYISHFLITLLGKRKDTKKNIGVLKTKNKKKNYDTKHSSILQSRLLR